MSDKISLDPFDPRFLMRPASWPQVTLPPINLYNAPKQEGLKYDSGKPRMGLIDPLAAQGLARVLTFGANKYAADNWRNGINFTRLIDSLERHLAEIKKGVDVDPESGEQHIDHLGCCWMFLSNYMKNPRYKEFDDRWYKLQDSLESSA